MRVEVLIILMLTCLSIGDSKASADIGGACPVRGIYLNGVDISGAFGQEMKNVNIHINDKGDVYISAPHYQAFEEDHYLPVSNYLKSLQTPEHKKPMAISPPSLRGPDLNPGTIPSGIPVSSPAFADPEKDKPASMPPPAAPGYQPNPPEASEPDTERSEP